MGTGIFTGSVFDDKYIAKNGLLGEKRPPSDGSTIVQKTHHDTLYRTTNRRPYLRLAELMFNYRGIILIRNPYYALVSYWNYIKTHSHRNIPDFHKINKKGTHFQLQLIEYFSLTGMNRGIVIKLKVSCSNSKKVMK